MTEPDERMGANDRTGWFGDPSSCPIGRRRRGPALLNAIHSAALAELAEHGLGALTMEGVAAAAGTGKASLYRRWASKEDLVLDALTCTMLSEGELEGSSGRLRDDLLSHFGQMATFISGPGGAIVRNLMSSATAGSPVLEMARTRLIEPKLERLRRLIELGVRRGQARPGSATRTLAQVGPAIVMHRFLLYGKVTDDDVREIVDDVVLPLLQVEAETDAAPPEGKQVGAPTSAG